MNQQLFTSCVIFCYRWCDRKGWHKSHLLLALPQVYQQKANVAIHTYEGPLRQNALSRWMRLKLQDKIENIQDFRRFKDEWLAFKSGWQESEVRALLFTDQDIIPMFFSALSVKFPGRVKFGVVNKNNASTREWAQTLLPEENVSLPLYLIVTSEKAYVYGNNQGDCLTFSSMETLLKFLHPCLNDIFIFSFLVANLISFLELVTAQGRLGRRFQRFLWCVVKYNAAVIMLWLPLIAMFQLPYLDHLPLLGLKFSRVLTTSSLGEAFRRDIFFYSQHTYILTASFLLACTIFGILAYRITGGTYEDDNEPWFNFAQMRTLTHLRTNEFFEPMSIGGYDLSGGMDIFGSRLYLPTMSLQSVVSEQYISLLHTWPYCSVLKLQECSCTCSLQQCTEASSSKEAECVGSADVMNVDTARAAWSSHSPASGLPEPLSPCTASANDLLDGNYHCECQQHGGVDSPPIQSLSSQGQGASTDYILSQNSDSFSSSEEGTNFTECQGCQQQKGSTTTSFAESNVCPAKEKTSDLGSSSGCSFESESPSTDGTEFPEGYLPCSQCVICLEEYSVGVTLCGLPCGHVFHHSCILTWLKRDHHFCPVCRWPSFRPRPQVVHAHAE